MIQQAITKIDAELKTFAGGTKETAVKNAVARTLKELAEQDEEFAQAIVQTDETLSDCCNAIMQGVGSSISDHDAYRKAVQFYFKGAEVRFHMVIDLNPEDTSATEKQHAASKILDIADFFA